MTKSKYIIVDENGIELPVIFNPILNHKTIAGSQRVVAAGFCLPSSSDGKYKTWGASVSLGLASRPQDASILNDFLAYDT